MSALRVAVLGAGVSGLVAARELHRHGADVTVFEASPHVAGLATTHRDEEGFSYDLGAHFITNRLAAAVGVSGECWMVRRYGEVVPVDGRFRRYPTGLLRVPRFVASAGRSRLSPTGVAPEDAQTWFRTMYGRALADEIALPLVEAWSGVPADQLSSSVGEKIPGGIAQTVLLRAAGRILDRAVAIGYCGSQPQSASVWHVYPERGVATLCEHLAGELGGRVRTGAPVQAVHVEDGRVVGVEVAGERMEVDAVVSTAPVNVLPRLVRGAPELERFARFRYRPMVLVNLKLRGRDLLADTVVWVPRGAPFFRLTEAPRSMPWQAPEGKTLVLCDIGAEVGDTHWSMDDEALGELCLSHLEPYVKGATQRYLGCRVVRTKIAYPVYLREYEQDRRDLVSSGTGVEGLLSVGRNGEFSHSLMEDVYWRTIAALYRQLPALAAHHRAA